MNIKLRRLIAQWDSIPEWKKWFLYVYVSAHAHANRFGLRARALLSGALMSVLSWNIYNCNCVDVFSALLLTTFAGLIMAYVGYQRLRAGYTMMQSLCVSAVAFLPAAAVYRDVITIAPWQLAGLLSSAAAVMMALFVMLTVGLMRRRYLFVIMQDFFLICMVKISFIIAKLKSYRWR